MKKSLSIFFVISIFTVSAFAQSSNSAEELLRYFPQGTYPIAMHGTLEDFSDLPSFSLLESHFFSQKEDSENEEKSFRAGIAMYPLSRLAELHTDRTLSLPDALKKGLYSFTIANPTQLADLPDEENGNATAVTFELAGKNGTESKVGMFIVMNKTLAVFRYEDLQSTMEYALSKNVLVETGEFLEQMPVYTFSHSKNGDRKSDQFVIASPNNELLMASDIEDLERMVLTGYGQMMSMLDSDAYAELISILPDLGPTWSMQAFGKTSEQLDDLYHGKQISAEKLAAIKERERKRPFLKIESLILQDELIHKQVEVYQETEMAEESMQAPPEKSPFKKSAEAKAFEQLKANFTDKELINNFVVTSTRYNNELLKAELNAGQSMNSVTLQGGKFKMTTPDGQEMTIVTEQKDGKITMQATQEVK